MLIPSRRNIEKAIATAQAITRLNTAQDAVLSASAYLTDAEIAEPGLAHVYTLLTQINDAAKELSDAQLDGMTL